MMPEVMMICPLCKKELLGAENPFRPFCSERCKLIDLGNWAAEDYRIPGEKQENSPGTEHERESG
jgi:hypothetical protein